MTSPTALPGSAMLGDGVVSPENYSFLQGLVYRDSGIVLDETKLYLMEARLLPLTLEQKLKTLNDLCALLRANAPGTLRRRVIEAMTTNETLFFRDAGAFAVLHSAVLPRLLEARASSRRLTVWSAAASSGQEAYSLAMMLLEMGLSGWDLRVLGTDLNHQILDRARTGLYQQLEVNRGLPAKYLVKYFRHVGSDWQLCEQVMRMVDFAPFDLRDNIATLGSFDLVLCRNVLIYFDMETKRKILAGIRRVLNPGGMLLLGCAESTLNLSTEFSGATFSSETMGSAIFYHA